MSPGVLSVSLNRSMSLGPMTTAPSVPIRPRRRMLLPPIIGGTTVAVPAVESRSPPGPPTKIARTRRIAFPALTRRNVSPVSGRVSGVGARKPFTTRKRALSKTFVSATGAAGWAGVVVGGRGGGEAARGGEARLVEGFGGGGGGGGGGGVGEGAAEGGEVAPAVRRRRVLHQRAHARHKRRGHARAADGVEQQRAV